MAAFDSNYMLKSYQLTFTPCISDEAGLIDFFSSLFELKKLSVVKRKEKAVQELVLVIGSCKNSDMIDQPGFGFKDSKCTSKVITSEEADALIIKNRTKLYVGAIPYGVDNVKIWNHFAQYGTLEYSYIIRKPERNGKKGFGFVIFKRRAPLERALFENHFIDGKKLICSEFSCKAKMNKQKSNMMTNDQSKGCDPEVNQVDPKKSTTKKPLRVNQNSFNYAETIKELNQIHLQRFSHDETNINERFSPERDQGSKFQEEFGYSEVETKQGYYHFDCNYLQSLDRNQYTNGYPEFNQFYTPSESTEFTSSRGGLQDYRLRKSAYYQGPVQAYNSCYSCF